LNSIYSQLQPRLSV